MPRTLRFLSAFTGPGLPGLYSQNHTLRPFYDEGDGGGDGEGGGAEGDGGAEGGGDGGQQQMQAHEFKDLNGHVRLPGMKDPIAVKELAAALQSRSSYDAGLKTMGQIAELLNKQRQAAPAAKPGAGQQPTGQQKDALAALEQMEVLGGKDVATILRQIGDGTLTPMAKALIAMGERLKAVEGHVGGFRQADAEVGFNGEVGNAITALKLPQIDGKPIEGQDVLKDLVRDLFFSYDEDSQKQLRGDTLNKVVQERFNGYRTFFRNLEKATLEAARTRQRQRVFAKPGAGSSANGKPRKMMTNSDVAAALFGGQAGADA